MFNWNESTFFSTIALLDSVSSRFQIDPELFGLLSLACLSLMVKIRESSYMRFDLQKICFIFGIFHYDVCKFNQLEKSILKIHQFDLNVVTSFDFVQFFMRTPDMFLKPNKIESHNEFKMFYNLALKIHFLMLEDYSLNKYTPLALAIAGIMLSRKVLQISPLLPEQIQNETGCLPNAMEGLLKKLEKMLIV
jgi:hypothetical protein